MIIDYINRFWINDVDARMQLFDLKTKYQFQTVPTVDQYNMPLYSVQTEPGGQDIAMYPVYQGFVGPAYVNGVQCGFQTQKTSFFNLFPKITQQLIQVATGDGGSAYNFKIPILPHHHHHFHHSSLNGILRGHIDITGIMATGMNQDPPLTNFLLPEIPVTSVDSAFFITSIDATGASVVVQDSGQFLIGNVNHGLLMAPGPAPFGNIPLGGGYSDTSNTVNYLTGHVHVTFPVSIPLGNQINVQCFYFETGLPRSMLFYNNTLILRTPPDKQYLVEIDAYLSPAAFLSSSQAIPFGYMCEYIARGAARKILSDTGDWDQYDRYEPLFIEQEQLVWKRSQRQWTATRTETIYSQGVSQGIGQQGLGSGRGI